jgi:hypothetical protein
MKLSEYLKTRGVRAKALSKREATLIGVGWPLKSGWPEVHKDKLIPDVLVRNPGKQKVGAWTVRDDAIKLFIAAVYEKGYANCEDEFSILEQSMER